jgi:hypothetical protein
MNDLPQNLEELMEELSKKRSSERDKNMIIQIDYFDKIFKEMRSKDNSLKRKKIIEKIFFNI